jgi:hypothetical protein
MESLNQFLGEFPNAVNSYDRRRFIKYAFEVARAEKAMDVEAFRRAGVAEERIKSYLDIYSWIREIQGMLDRGEL